MIRILFLIDKLVPAGTQNNLLEIVRGLDRSRFHPYVMALAAGGALAPEFAAAGVPVKILGVKRAYGFSGLKAYFFLKRWMKENNIDIVQTHFLQADLIGSLAARAAGVKKIITGRRDEGFWRSGRQVFLNRRLNRLADRILANAWAVETAVCKSERVSPEKIHVIHNGVMVPELSSTVREAARKELGIQPEEIVIGMLANMRHAVKGHIYFLEAAEKIHKTAPRARFLLIGEGDLRASLEVEAYQRGLDKAVIFAGARRDTAALIQAMDIGVSSSLSEGLSNSILEMMALGKPMVATHVGGNAEIVKEETGFLVPPKNPEALAEKILSLIQNDEIRHLAGRAARRHILENFSMEKMISGHETFYESLLQRREPASVCSDEHGAALRVCHLIWALEPGGAERQVITIAASQKRQGMNPRVVCLTRKGLLAGELEAQGIRVDLIYKKPGKDFSIIGKLAAYLRRHQIQLLHTHVPTANLWGRLASFWVPDLKVIVTEHSDLAAVHPVFKRINQVLNLRTDAYVVVSDHIRILMGKAGIQTGKIKVIHNGIPITTTENFEARLRIRSSLGIKENQVLIGTVGRLEPRKDHRMFLEAAKKVISGMPEARFLLVGDGPLREELELFADQLGLDESQLIFSGIQQNPAEWLSAMDLFVLSSVTEGVSISLLEAMAAGKPCIVTRVGGNPEVVEDGRTGVLVPSGNPEALAEAILRLAKEPSKMKQYRDAAQSEVLNRFSEEAMMKRLNHVYDSLFNAKKNLRSLSEEDSSGSDPERKTVEKDWHEVIK